MKKTILTYFFIFLAFLSLETLCIQQKIAVVSIPKAGTHMIRKCIKLLLHYSSKNSVKLICTDPLNQLKFIKEIATKDDTIISSIKNESQSLKNKDDYWFVEPAITHQKNYWLINPIKLFDLMEKTYSKYQVFWTQGHTEYDESLAQELAHRDYKVILNIRDPRDRLLSTARWIKKDPLPKDHPFKEKLEMLSMNELIKFLLLHPEKIRHNAGADYYYNQMKWLNHKNCCLVKFESLVGSHGGGTKKEQINEIKKIATHIGLTNLAEKDFSRIARKLFGGTPTFQKGKKDSWKKEMTTEQKEFYYSIPGNKQLLVDLKYEKF